eukprot:265105-Chlamydomonas_euryale.AAC.1
MVSEENEAVQVARESGGVGVVISAASAELVQSGNAGLRRAVKKGCGAMRSPRMAQGDAAGSILGVRTPPAGARAARLSNDDSAMVRQRQDIGSGGRVRGAAFVGCGGGAAVRSQGVAASGALC